MVTPTAPLRLLAQYEHAELPDDPGPDELKAAIRVWLKNCHVTVAFRTEQMKLLKAETELYATVCQAGKEALLAIPLAEAALRASTLEDFNAAVQKFRESYGRLIGHIHHYVFLIWQQNPQQLPDLVHEVM